jgi:hypothetical protein
MNTYISTSPSMRLLSWSFHAAYYASSAIEWLTAKKWLILAMNMIKGAFGVAKFASTTLTMQKSLQNVLSLFRNQRVS